MSDFATPDPRRLLRVRETRQEGSSALTVVFEVTEAAKPMSYRPGQFLTLLIPFESETMYRNYSLSSSPQVDEHLGITVQRVAGGRASTWINECLAPGMYLEAYGPSGAFTPRDLDRDLILIASGSGIGPIFSILKSVVAAGKGRVSLLYLTRVEVPPFAGAIEDLESRNADRLKSMLWNSRRRGRMPTADLTAFLEYEPGRDVYLCGSTRLMDTCERLAIRNGFEGHRIHREDFLPEMGAPSGILPQTVDATVQLNGEIHHWAWNNKHVLLDSMLLRGIDAPFSCRAGICSACQCRVLRGHVVMQNAGGLDAEQINENVVLACQSHAMSASVELDFDI